MWTRLTITLVIVLPVNLFGANAKEEFSQTAWKRIETIYLAIVDHPFNQELRKGTLSKDRFNYYSEQDSLYLVQFSKALLALAEKLETPEDARMVRELATDGVEAEQAARTKVPRGIIQSPSTLLYTNFLLATAAYGSKEELAAALLPCFWIYLKLADDITAKIDKSNPYHQWVKIYSSTDYRKSVRSMIDLTDRLAGSTTKAKRIQMLRAFVLASKMEWYFWDAAYNREKWKPM